MHRLTTIHSGWRPGMDRWTDIKAVFKLLQTFSTKFFLNFSNFILNKPLPPVGRL